MTIAMRHVVKFPANVQASKGIDVLRANGIYSFKLNYENLAAAGSVSSNVQVAFQDPATGAMGVTTLSSALNSNANIQAIANAETGASKLGYWNGSSSYALTDFSAFGRTLVAAGDATGARTSLGMVIGTDVQAHSGNLDSFASKTAPSGSIVGTSDTQTLTGKTIDGDDNTFVNVPSAAVTGLSPVATSGAYADLSGLPTLGDLAAKDQAAIADIDATGAPSSTTALFGDGTWKTPAGGGDMVKSSYDPNSVDSDAFDSANTKFKTTGTSAVSRSVSNKFKDVVSAKDFGAFGDGSTDDTAALQAAIDQVIPDGIRLWLPRGVYPISGSGLSITNTGAGSTGGTQSIGYRTAMFGDGAGSSILQWLGTTGTCLKAEIGGDSRVEFSGFSVLQTGATKQGTGLLVSQTAHAAFTNIAAEGFTTGVKIEDCFSLNFNQARFANNVDGVSAAYAAITRPNDINFNQCIFRNNTEFAGLFANPTNLNIVGGACENNGSGSAGQGGFKINGNPVDGIVGLNLRDVYFEGNNGSFDVGIYDANGGWGIHNIEGNGFHRISNTAFTSTNIAFFKTTSNKSIIRVHGNGFQGFNTYVPNSGRKYIQAPTPVDDAYIFDIGVNIWGSSTEYPDDLVGPRASKNMVAAAVRFDGTSGTITGAKTNIASVTRNGTGDYTITYARTLANSKNIYSIGMTETVGSAILYSETASTLTFKTYNASGVQADFSNISVLVYGADKWE